MRIDKRTVDPSQGHKDTESINLRRSAIVLMYSSHGVDYPPPLVPHRGDEREDKKRIYLREISAPPAARKVRAVFAKIHEEVISITRRHFQTSLRLALSVYHVIMEVPKVRAMPFVGGVTSLNLH
ncbi:hypothetical protein EVAR_54447_1 [Eumeta japonica]|uniref:Uncharacterized protein n=1 Tax=Eumeta variegata TaxID=151549 RepID=A0A4C1XJL0_EUMVA|nr:hypothetical protein EVAR_54447_1 [Eumeta japonica]